ncbi:MAG: hypothetical protein KAR65_11210 [Anaerolineales bacterium]|nr:hypothetical protein [Anaerolineales bacterium]
MKRIRIKRLIGILVSIVGGAIAFTAIAADTLGIDRDAGWGPARTFLLGAGLVVIISPHWFSFLRFVVSGLKKLYRQIYSSRKPDNLLISQCRDETTRQASGKIPAQELTFERQDNLDQHGQEKVAKLQASKFPGRSISALTKERLVRGSIGFSFIITVVLFTWIISVGRWTDWPNTTNYFHLLGDGFRAGETSLLVEPSEDLVALENPYKYESRESVQYLWDASLHEGKYYLYWGPSSALTIIILETLISRSLGDQHLVWFFITGTVIFTLLLLFRLWKDFFSDLAWWSIFPIALAAGLAAPIPWLVSRPEVYEAAIAAGQFFLIGGFFWVYSAGSDGKVSLLRLFLGGLFLILAMGSRISLAPAIVFLSIISVWWLYRREKQNGRMQEKIPGILAFGGPLLMGGFVLAWYNIDRFGSIFEYGHRYQLGWNDLSQYSRIISIDNVIQNIYNYLLTSYRTLNVFPFVKPNWGSHTVPFLRSTAPQHFHAEPVTGLLLGAPLLLIAFIPLAGTMFRAWRSLETTPEEKEVIRSSDPLRTSGIKRLYWLLTGVVLLEIGPLLFFDTNSMRYIVDVTPTLVLLSGIAFWLYLRALSPGSWKRRLFAISVGGLSLYTIMIGSLLSVTGQSMRFETLNPDFFERIVRFFAW